MQELSPQEIRKQEHYKEGRITVLEAAQRCGKTLGMAILALDEFIATRKPITTNIAYEDPITRLCKIPFKPLNFFELTMEKIGVFTNRCITIDELNFYLDCRGSMTKMNRRFCQWLLQSKKMGINTYGTTHSLAYLDLRFQENYDFLIQPKTYYAQDFLGNPIPRYLVLKWFNGPNQNHFRKTVTVDFAKRPDLLGLYNSRHTFNPFAEMEEQMAIEKLQLKSKRKNMGRSLKDLVPDYMPDFLNKDSQGVSVT